jgi:hypothetical protein
MSNWTLEKLNNKIITSIDDIPNNQQVIGFVYRITNLKTGKIYIGKKSLFTTRKTAISKREIAATATRKRVKRTTKESNWTNYWGSCKELNDEIAKTGKRRQQFRQPKPNCFSSCYFDFESE